MRFSSPPRLLKSQRSSCGKDKLIQISFQVSNRTGIRQISYVTVREAITRYEPSLHAAGIESARVDTEWLLVHLLGLSRSELQLETERILTLSEQEQLQRLIEQRGQRIPLQHLLGEVDFRGLRLQVDGRALVPRPETEFLAEVAIGILSKEVAPRALDVGTGSGCLAISIAVACPCARIDALDISADALVLARKNTVRHQVTERILYMEGDGRESLPGGPYHIIISNPPYIPTGDLLGLQPEVRDHDPRLALDGGPDGLEFFRALAVNSAASLCPSGQLLLEVGDGQASAVGELFTNCDWRIELILEDLAGIPRIVIATPAVS